MWGLADTGLNQRGNLATPGSYCPHCGSALKIRHLVPLLSYLFQRGRCANCNEPISVRYPLVELTGAATALIAIISHGLTIEAALLAVFLWTLIPLAVIDLETGYLPDMLTLPLIALGIGFNITGKFVPFKDALIGAAIGYLAFRLIGEAFIRLRNKEGLGQGDAKLLSAIGAWAGWMVLAPTVFLAALSTLLIIGLLMVCGRTIGPDTEIPFGPALALGGAVLVILTSNGFTLERLAGL